MDVSLAIAQGRDCNLDGNVVGDDNHNSNESEIQINTKILVCSEIYGDS
jgi:hypothetical protein